MFFLSLAETSTLMVLPPQSSTSRFSFESCCLTRVDVGVGLVDLVDGHDDRDVGRLGVVDGLLGLGHDAVVGGDDQDDDVRSLGPAGPELGEGLVTRRVDEGDEAVLDGDPVGADVLGDAARFLVDEVRGADGVEQGRLAVIDVAHDGDDGGARCELGRPGLGQRAHGLVESDELRVEVGDPGDGRRGLGVDEIVEVGGDALGVELVDQVLGPELHGLRGVLDLPALPEGYPFPGLGRRGGRGRLGRARPGVPGGPAEVRRPACRERRAPVCEGPERPGAGGAGV